ncbi:hypothetical protein KUTeg_005241 [Tegillarca granosa]|uniref:Cilia- and flagella-associated protein 58 central coiled coil domain-containing protein n=1 Tax=Tegillarca granosa TaxID=220873 RepID=A0ABQ9FN39_TEGGR|nr:hypothetical protein KUTeg_005241 [Tegillarca granosa]
MSEEKKEKSEKEKGVIDDSAFESLERDFQDVLSQLTGDRSLDKFRTEYEKLHKALKKSHESEKRLMQKCRELNAEIVANSARVSQALKLTQEDSATIASLRKEIEKAWKMVDAAHEKETRARETIQSLKMEIANLSKLVEQGAGLTMGQEHSVNELLKAKEDLTRERDEHFNEIVKLREQLAETSNRQSKLDTEKAEAQEKIQELTQDIQVRNNEAQRETRKRDKLERELKQAKADLDAKSGEIKTIQTQIGRYKEDIGKLEQQIKEQRVLNERLLKDNDIVNTRFTKLQQDFETQLINTDQLTAENQSRVTELKQKEDEVNQLKQETQRLNKTREMIQRKLRQVEDNKGEIEQSRETLKGQIIGLERELEATKKQAESEKKKNEDLIREKDILHKTVVKAAKNTEKQINLVKLHESSIKTLEQDIQNYKEEAQKQRKIIYQLEKERDRYINEASDLTQKVLSHMEDVKTREMEIFEYKKKIAEAETKLKQQQNLYEAVRSDRNLYSKNLIESQDEITEMKRKQKIMSHQIDQYKEEIQSKEANLVKEKAEHVRVEKEKDALKEELQKMKNEAKESKAYIEAQQAEERKLLKIIAEADAERVRQKKELDQGSDPSTYEMIQKIHALQKRLIAKTEEVVEKELLIQEKEKLHLELNHVLARQPGPEVAEQLQIYQQTLKDKTKQMKSMASELNMYESQVGEYKYEIERIARELQEVKKKYFMQKKKEMQIKERDRALAQAGAPVIQPQRTDGPRFTGGGFNLKQSKTAA